MFRPLHPVGTLLYAENVRGVALEIISYFGYWMVSAAIHPPILVALIVLASRESFFQKKKKTQIKKENIMLVDVATVKRSGDAEVGFQIYLSLKVGGGRNFQKKWELQKLVSYILFIVERVVYDIN